MPRARNWTIASPRAAASRTRQPSGIPMSSPSASTSTVPTTVATITTPSLTLIELSRSSGRIGHLGLERVPDAVHRSHVTGPELAAQAAHMRIHRALAGAVPPAPHVGEQLLARVHHAGAGCEQRQ